MKNLIQKLLLNILLFSGFDLSAQYIINFDTISNKSVEITDANYTIGGVSARYTGSYVFTGSADLGENFYTLIYDGAYTDTTFTFSDLYLKGSCPLYFYAVNNQMNYFLNLQGNNEIEGTAWGLMVVNCSLTISGDSLVAISGMQSPAIGAESSGKCYNIICNSGYIHATSISLYPAIGAKKSNCDSIIVNGGTITTVCNGSGYGLQAKKCIQINGGSVKGTLSMDAMNKAGSTVYCVTVPHNKQLSIGMNDGTKDTTLTFYAHHPDDANFYIYLPNGNYSFTNGDGENYTAVVNGANVSATIPSVVGNGYIDVSSGKVVSIHDTVYYIGSQPYIYQGHRFVITGTSSTGGVTVDSKLADTIIFENVDIQMIDGCAFKLNTGTDIALVLNGMNVLKSTGTYSALEKDSTNGTLIICGPDTLVAAGSSRGNGIGGCHLYNDVSCGNITIKGGTVFCSGLYGIGGGSKKAGIITIEGGRVFASTNESEGAALGNSEHLFINGGSVRASSDIEYDMTYPLSGTVTINGGIVNILSKQGTNMPKGITINGGTVFAANEYEASTTFTGGMFTGGTINLVEADGKTVDISLQPVNEDSALLYRSMYRIPDISKPTQVESITINGTAWGSNDVFTDSAGILYLWAPEAKGSEVKITVEGKEFTYTGDVIAYNDYILADESQKIPEYGNYLWMVPVDVAVPENGTLEVSCNGIALETDRYFCYKTELPLSIIASPANGYVLDGITVHGERTLGDTTITVLDTITVTAVFSQKTGIQNMEETTIATVYTCGQEIFVKAKYGLQVSVYSALGVLLSSAESDGELLSIPVDMPGMYIMQISDENGSLLKKCIIK